MKVLVYIFISEVVSFIYFSGKFFDMVCVGFKDFLVIVFYFGGFYFGYFEIKEF